jgi:Zn-dependent protease with chaperone function
MSDFTQEQFDALVARLEGDARDNPRHYRLRVTAFALLGYAYLGAMLALLLLLVLVAAASVVYLKWLGIKLLFVLLPFVWLVASAMRVELTPPQGILLRAQDAPELFERLDRLRRALKAPRFHRVLVNDEFNAAVSQVPRLGLFGWHRNYLVLGLPLLKSLTPEQFDAVLAHELGHLAGGHARFGNWLYRLRAVWQQLREALARQQSNGAFLFRGFLNWYAPRFAAYSFPLARADEYEADAVSARLCSSQAMAEALTGINVIGEYLGERYWPAIHAQSQHQPAPAFAPFNEFGRGFAEELLPEHTGRWLQRALQRCTSSADTHPALADRLRAVGADPRLAVPAPGEGADRLLGATGARIVAELDERWRAGVDHDWRSSYEQACSGRARLAELAEQAEQGELALTIDEAVERGRLEADYGAGAASAIAQLQALLPRAGEHAFAHFVLGRMLLDADDAAGEPLVRRAIELDHDATGPGLALLRDFHWRRGDAGQANALQRDHVERCELEQAAAAERAEIHLKDRFIAHGLPPAATAALADELRALGVRSAWLVRKDCRVFPERPLYLVGFRRVGRFGLHRQARALALQQRIVEQIVWPGETFVICLDGENRRFRSRLKKVPGAQLL